MSSAGSHAGLETPGLDANGARAAVLVTRFHGDITERLLEGARACLEVHGAGRVDVYRVPGAWELPQAAAQVLARGGHECIITLGCVVRGETPHFHYVCAEATRGLGAVARTADVPVVFGVLTTDTMEQALARSEEGPGNKGWEAALAALQMLELFRGLAGE